MTADPSYDPGVADGHGTGGRAYDYGSELGFGFVTEEVTIESGHNISRGMCLGKVSASGEFAPVDDAQTDGSETLRAVLAEDIDTSGGAAKAVVYRNGVFAEEKVSFGGDDTVADHREAAAEKGFYFKSIYTK